jgi:putative nucleotidyltransferase with HDIG domain
MNFPQELITICKVLQDNGFESYIVGGSVRDILMKKEPKDYDITTSASISDIERLFPECYSTIGKNREDLGTRAIKEGNMVYEITPYRKDGLYMDNRHPESVEFGVSLRDDLSRRDFTMNAIAMNPITGEIIDPFSGRLSLGCRTIKCVSNADKRFKEDSLRILRAVRFASQLGFYIHWHIVDAIKRNCYLLDNISQERKRDELMKTLLGSYVSYGLDFLFDTEIGNYLLPELVKCKNVLQQFEHHRYDVFKHCIECCKQLPKEKPLLRLAGLLHDVAKPDCKTVVDSKIHFYEHEEKSAVMAEEIMKRFKFSTDDVKYVVLLIREHMITYDRGWKKSSIRRLIARVGRENILDLIKLRKADVLSRGVVKHLDDVNELHERVIEVLNEKPILKVSNLVINGEDVMREFNIPQGKKIGEILKAMHDAVLEDKVKNDREELFKYVKNNGV